MNRFEICRSSQAISVCADKLPYKILFENSVANLNYKICAFVNFETSKIEYRTLYITTYCHIVTHDCTICDIEFGHVMAALEGVLWVQ